MASGSTKSPSLREGDGSSDSQTPRNPLQESVQDAIENAEAMTSIAGPSRSPLSRLSRALTNLSYSDPEHGIRKRDFGFLPIPKYCRYDTSLNPDEQPLFNWRINLVFAACATVSVMNLYYIQPILVDIADDFGVSHDTVAIVPTLAQAGYGCGIAFISPLGDLVRRRQLVLLLMILTTTLSIGLALARNVQMLQGLTFVVGMLTVTPQICIPWTADLAPSNRRARSMSITLSGLVSGLVFGRVFSGVIAETTNWRNSYWLAVGLQGCMLVVAWSCLPDTPDKKIGLSYFGTLWSMVEFMVKFPTLVQAGMISFCMSAVFAGFWTTLSFLLSDPPYNYTPLTIGLLSLLGIVGAVLAPQMGLLIDKIVPWSGQFVGICINLTSMIIAISAAQKNVGAVCVSILLYDTGQSLIQVSSSYRIAGLDPKARGRLNGCYLLCLFAGQTSGTAIMTKIYNSKGWHATGGCAIAFVVTAMLILLARGPHESGWVGWGGGREFVKREKLTDLSPHALTENLRVKRHKHKGKEEEAGVGNEIGIGGAEGQDEGVLDSRETIAGEERKGADKV